MEKRQERSKHYSDKRRGAKTPAFKPGDWVRVKKPEHVHKGTSKFTPPLPIQRQIGPSTFVLSDNKRWNASRLTRYPAGPGLPAVEKSHTAPVTPRRGARTATAPAWLMGFQLG